jgi:hypothetical protein
MSSVLALSPATSATLAMIAIWVIGFPALVTGLIAFAVVQARGEAQENEAERHRRGGSR